MAKFKQALNIVAAALVALTSLVAMTVTAGAASAPLKKPPVAQQIAPKSTAPVDRPAFDAEDQEHAIIPGFFVARFSGASEKGFLQATRVAMGPWLSLSFFFVDLVALAR